MSVKNKLKKVKEKLTFGNHKRAYSFIIAGVIVVTLFLIWFLGTPTGHLAQQSFSKSFNHVLEEHVIEVYSGNTKIKEYVGFYRVEEYKNYLVILDDVTGERIDVYGNAIAIINSPRYMSSEREKGVE